MRSASVGDVIPAGVGSVLLRFVVWQAVEGQADEALRVALTAALERGDRPVSPPTATTPSA